MVPCSHASSALAKYAGIGCLKKEWAMFVVLVRHQFVAWFHSAHVLIQMLLALKMNNLHAIWFLSQGQVGHHPWF